MSESKCEGEVLVSAYPNIFKPKSFEVPLCQIMEEIKNGKWKNEIEHVRSITDEEKYKKEKKKIPAFTVSGVFEGGRKEENLKVHSNRLNVDIDKLNGRFDAVRQALRSDIYTEYLFTSAGGNGLSVVIKIDGTRHGESFDYLRRYYQETYNIGIDKACRDVSRLRFVSYDPNLFRNVNSQTLVLTEPATEHKKKNEHKCTNDSKDRNRKFVEALIESGILIGDDSYDSWVRIGFALVSEFGESGRELFHGLSKPSPKYDPVLCDSKYSELLKDNRGEIKLATVVHLAKEAGFAHKDDDESTPDPPGGETKQKKKKKKKFEPVDFGDFWMIDEAGSIELCQGMLLDFLENNGFHRYQPSKNEANYVYVRCENNLVVEVERFQMKDFVMNYLKEKIAKG